MFQDYKKKVQFTLLVKIVAPIHLHDKVPLNPGTTFPCGYPDLGLNRFIFIPVYQRYNRRRKPKRDDGQRI